MSASSRDVGARVAERLRDARVGALALQRQERAWPLVSPGLGMALRLRLGVAPVLRSVVVATLMLSVFAVGQQWTSASGVGAHDDIDAALLIDDLPIDAYLDRDFKAWVFRELRS
ncbi:MAG: DUF3619 family protein [Rhodocyclales bacterium]|nr:DUF3619 family protein [Rhodocyclales bacterium]